MNYDEYINRCDQMRTTNDEFLNLFEQDLNKYSLTSKTINRHLSNASFYINTYLLNEEILPMVVGTERIDDFLGFFFIRKCIWSTPANIKTTATSIKKFYKCMLDHGKIEKNDYEFLCSQIRADMDTWQYDCALFNE